MISWIKLDVNILDDAKIKIIRSHPDGNSIVLLWIGLLCLAMKSARPGIIEISNGLPYTVDDLASAFSIEKKTVELGLMLFKKYQMIDIFDGDTIEVINFAKHQSIEELERKRELTRARVTRYREKLMCNALLTHDTRSVTLTDKIRQDKIYTSDFLSFYSAYPRHVGKEAAWKAWKKYNGNIPPLDVLINKINEFKKTEDWQKDKGKFIPHPATWLNGKRWEDEGVVLEAKSSW